LSVVTDDLGLIDTLRQRQVSRLRSRPLRNGHGLFVGDNGRFFRAGPSVQDRLNGGGPSEEDLRFLDGEWHVLGSGSLERRSRRYAEAQRLGWSHRLDYLILVPTLRCNLSCTYAQGSAASLSSTGHDWSDATLAAVLDQIDRLETTSIKIEFQGGEPTLRLDLIKAVIDRCQRFERREFVVCTNLQYLDDEVLELFARDEVYVSTSLDGGAATHLSNRTATDSGTRRFLDNLNMIIERFGVGKVSALPTIDPRSPPEPDELIDTYAGLGFNSIFLRPINFHGFARKRHPESREQQSDWRRYYERFIGRLIERNWQDRSRVLEETYLGVCLRRIFQPGSERHVDLRSPNPVGVDYVVIDHDGTVYPTDEARMLARSGIIDLAIGSVETGWDTPERATLDRHSTNEFDPACRQCAYQPFCGRDVIDDIARYGTIDMPRTETEFCRKHMYLFDLIFELVYSDDPAVRHSVCRWLRLPGTPVELGPTLP